MSPLIFRVDADARQGWGHLIRCLAVADAWRDTGGRALFVSRRGRDWTAVRQRVRDRGHRCWALDAADEADDLRLLRAIVEAVGSAWVVLDGYHFSSSYQRAVRSSGVGLAVFDDTGHLPTYHCDLLINSSPVADAIAYACDADTRLLLGPRYVPLRQEVLHARRERPTRASGIRLLVTLGGGDQSELLLKIVAALRDVGVALAAQIVVGPSRGCQAQLEAELRHHPDARIELVHATDDLPDRMCWADCAISAAGGTLWELAFLGVPTAAITLADNQRPIANWLAEQGGIVSLGDAATITPTAIAAAIANLLGEPRRQTVLSGVGQPAVDGRGAVRIVHAILQAQLGLRSAEELDSALIWHWANEPSTRAASFSSLPIEWSTHAAWFVARRNDADCLLLVASDAGGDAVGQIRFARRGDTATASISIDTRFRGLGLGTRLIRRGVSHAFDQWRGVRRVQAEVKVSNLTSRRAFERAGFYAADTIVRNGVEAWLLECERTVLP